MDPDSEIDRDRDVAGPPPPLERWGRRAAWGVLGVAVVLLGATGWRVADRAADIESLPELRAGTCGTVVEGGPSTNVQIAYVAASGYVGVGDDATTGPIPRDIVSPPLRPGERVEFEFAGSSTTEVDVVRRSERC